jgi:hypothetical protein
MGAVLTASRTTKPELYRRNTNLSLATSVHSLYAAALAGAATKGNTGVERIMV